MKIFILFSILLFSACENHSEKEITLIYYPFLLELGEIDSAVLTYRILYNDNPKTLDQLKRLSKEDFIKACTYLEVGKDTIIVPDLTEFSDSSITVKKNDDGIRVEYNLQPINYSVDKEIALMSVNFNMQLLEDLGVNFETGLNIDVKKNRGFIDFPDSNKFLANVTIKNYKAELRQMKKNSNFTQTIVATQQNFQLNLMEPVCLEL